MSIDIHGSWERTTVIIVYLFIYFILMGGSAVNLCNDATNNLYLIQ